MRISRRRFLRDASLATTAAIAPPILAQRPTRVLVVGAGAAGLTAAHDLVQSGFDVQLFEASERAGGRMYTLREPFSDGLYAEAGAGLLGGIGPGIEYAREFGLELLPLRYNPRLGSLSYFQGRRVEHRQDVPGNLPFQLRQDERNMSVEALHFRYRRRPMGQIENLAELAPPGLQADALDRLDNLTMRDFLKEQGASNAALEAMMYYYLPAYGDSLDEINLLQVVREAVSFTGATGAFTVAGGNDRICGELARRLGDRVHYQSPVRSVRQDEAGITLTLETRDGMESVTADVAILTPPPPVLRAIEFDSPLPEATVNALRAAVPVPVTRTYVQTRSRFWLEEGLNGNALTDLPVAQILHSTAMQQGERGILESMTYGNQANTMAEMSPAQQQAQLREALSQLYPESLDLDRVGTSYAWGNDPWYRCGHVAFRPGAYVAATSALRQPHGRLFFAGDTIWGVSGYSHAAFESGKEVAAAIRAAA